MPYTQDELQNYAFYQQLRNQDIEEYYDKIRNLVNEAAVSRSAVEPLRNSAGTFLSFEEEVNESRIGLSRDTPSEYLPVDQNSPQYRQDISLEKIIARGIASLREPAKKLGTVPLDPQVEGGPFTVRLKNGMIISDKDLTKIYYLHNNTKRSFVNNDIFRSYEDVFYSGGVGLTFIIRIKISSLNAIKNGNNLPFYFSSIGDTDFINDTSSTDTYGDVDPDDPDTYDQTPPPTTDGTYEGQYSDDLEWRWYINQWVPSYLYTGSGSSDPYTNECFTETALVSMADGTYKRIVSIKEGDRILTLDEKINEYSQGTVTDFLVHPVNRMVRAAKLANKEFENELIGTPDHPIYVNEKWDEIQDAKLNFESVNMFINNYYNLEVDGHNIVNGNHNYIVNGYVVSGLGDNPILNKVFSRQKVFKQDFGELNAIRK